ncbi:uncharacterized protein N7529_001335 [Penicillium soppii]|uniref:uncharacterized protein n=1 Tax=Penicillium soppii TaxID=69789 RepID=UPI0025479CC2|nr:uncharacterized protein N7529_001335 [Penicillium soppii]KAJ5882663.1 hypothetical protein N7529_001335 [Penicillium soppii]
MGRPIWAGPWAMPRSSRNLRLASCLIAYTVGPSSLPPSSQPDLSYVDDIFDPNLDLNIDPSLFNS